MLDPANATLKPLTAADLIWVSEMGFAENPEAALVLRGLPERSMEPAADLETILDADFENIVPYYNLLGEQQTDRGDGEHNETTGYYVYTPAHPIEGVERINMRKPKVRDIRLIEITGAGAAEDVQIISRLTGVKVDVLKRLRVGDFLALQEALMGFLAGSARPTPEQ